MQTIDQTYLTHSPNNAGIYIHIPFCKQACNYCDFHFSTNGKLKVPMLEAIKKELLLRTNYLGNAPITSIYFGGGTPSLLTSNEIASLLETIAKYYVLGPTVETTLEANPDDITFTKLKDLRHVGINRLSIGVQSFQDEVLYYMNRAHSGANALESILLAREAQFENISIDLIYAVPGTTEKRWEKDIEQAMSLSPEHIAAYCLTIEPKTVFGHQKEKGLLLEVDEDRATHQYELLLATLTNRGYEHYEISNFSKPGYYSQHNTNYWKKGGYLGVGPSAHSYNGIARQYNVANNYKYITSIERAEIPATVEILTRKEHINEYIMVSLRTQWGCDLSWLQEQYGYNLKGEKEAYFSQLHALQLIVIKENSIRLTHQGRLLADKIAQDLFVD